MSSTIHDSATCHCEMCEWAENVIKRRVSPCCERCDVSDEQERLELAYERGKLEGRASLAEDLLELRRLTAERMMNHD